MVYTRMKELGQQREYWSVLLGRLIFCGVVVALLLWQRLGSCMVFLSLALMTAASIVHAFCVCLSASNLSAELSPEEYLSLREVYEPIEDNATEEEIEEEIREIDAWCRHSIAKEFLQLRLLYLLFSVLCLCGIWNGIWGGDLLPFGQPCPAFLRFLLTAPVSMIPLAVLMVGEGVSLWIAPLLPDQEKPADE